jgi:ATP-dependent Lhr-like helicase
VLLGPAPDAALDLARRYARTHGPFTTAEFAARYALGRSTAEALLKTLHAGGRVLEGEFRPGGSGREWSDADVLQTIRRRSLAKLRKEVEPVEPPVLARLVTSWQGLVRPRVGLDALLDAIENLQGAPLPASILESDPQRAPRRLFVRRSRCTRGGRRPCGAASSRSAIATGASRST